MLIGWLYTPTGCTAPVSRGGDAQGGFQRSVLKPPLVGGAARFWRRGGNPPAPAFPRRGKRERGRSNFLAAAGICLRFTPGCRPPRTLSQVLTATQKPEFPRIKPLLSSNVQVSSSLFSPALGCHLPASLARSVTS